MSALDELIAKIEAGDESWVHLPRLPELRTDLVWKAWSGSLDAAKALHDALLPGWTWGRWSNGHAWVTDDVDDADRFITSKGYHHDNPARAWLIAILKAYRETQP